MLNIDVNIAKKIFEAASITDDVVMNMNKDNLQINICDQPRIMIANISVDSDVLENYDVEEEKVVVFAVDELLSFCKLTNVKEEMSIDFGEEKLILKSGIVKESTNLIKKIPNPTPEINLSMFPGTATISGKQFADSVRDISMKLHGECDFICLEIGDDVITLTSFDEMKKLDFDCDEVNTGDSFKVKSCFPFYTLQHIAKIFSKVETITILNMEENDNPFHFKGETDGVGIGFTIAPRKIKEE